MLIMKHLTILFLLFWGINTTFAYELVLPKEKKTITNSDYAFFVGKANKTEIISINDEKIYIADNGAFAHSVKLKEGENRIIIKSNFKTQIYKLYKELNKHSITPTLEEFEPKYYKVKNNNTPLRSTPINQGMNRISHLFKDTNLIINGQKGDFYRVYLSKNEIAWIDKNSVYEIKEILPPKFINICNTKYKNASKHTIEFSDNLPYTICEIKDEIILKIYNPFVPDNSIYTINIKKPNKYTYETCLNNGVYTFKVFQIPKNEFNNLENLIITIDAGHGGTENGAIGCLGDKEKDINLKIANELNQILSNMGANVLMVRECDANVSLENRINLAKKHCSNIFISIHLNSIPDVKFDLRKHSGTNVYYYNNNSKNLAEQIKNAITQKIKTKNNNIENASFAVIRPTEYLGILIEVAYMTNPNDSIIYTQENFAQETAKAIAEGLLNFLNE